MIEKEPTENAVKIGIACENLSFHEKAPEQL